MPDEMTPQPDSTAVRVALWRALHVQVDPPPHVLEDEVGLRLAAPDEGWREPPGHAPAVAPAPFRASIVARARFIEDLVVEQARAPASASTSSSAPASTPSPSAGRRSPRACRCSRSTSRARRPGSGSAWSSSASACPTWLRLVPVDFEAGDAWWQRLAAAGFDAGRPAVVASTGVSMYLTREAIAATLRQVAALAPGSTLAHDVPAAARAGRSRACAPACSAPATARAPAARRSSASSRRPRCWRWRARRASSDVAARVGRDARRALLRRPDRRPAPAEQRGGAAGRDDVTLSYSLSRLRERAGERASLTRADARSGPRALRLARFALSLTLSRRRERGSELD